MRGVQYSKFGKPENVMEFKTDIPVPKIETEEDVLIKVHAASINPVRFQRLRWLIGGPILNSRKGESACIYLKDAHTQYWFTSCKITP